jgi:hypothetical protein
MVQGRDAKASAVFFFGALSDVSVCPGDLDEPFFVES